MGSIVPFQDLNFHPESSSSTTSTTAKIIPKIEPKLEPLDEPPPLATAVHHFFSVPNNLNFSLTPNPATPVNSYITPVNNHPANNEVNDNVYSEFNRISEEFRSAFAQRLNKYDDVAVLEEPDNSRAIVPVPENTQQPLSNELAENTQQPVSNELVKRRKYTTRSKELVRVMDINEEAHGFFRGNVRKTRMLYDSLRILSMLEDERMRQLGQGPSRRSRGDLKAATLMRDANLWMNRDKRIVGSIPGVEVGDVFFFRMELCVVGLHGLTQAGIDYLPGCNSTNGQPIATSIIVSGGYEDDEDAGDVIIYTGHGGQDKCNRQVAHQKLECGNLAMERSMMYGVEVRVIRGFKYENTITTNGKVYVYDGLYKVVETWFDVGKSGFGVYKFKLVRNPNQDPMGTLFLRFAQSLKADPLQARPKGYISLDISGQRENLPVLCFNDIDGDRDPLMHEYLPKTIFPPHVLAHSGGSGTGCLCVGGCLDNCFCAMKNGGEFAYDQNGILLRGKPLIFECGPHCQCPPNCRNRVSQKGVKNRLEVFRSAETSWGVRSLDLIQAGAFICEYTGVVLTREQAQIFTMDGESLVYPNRFPDRWAEWGDLSPIFPDYGRPSFPSIPPLDFAMCVSKMRNVACYISHSSNPNVFVQPVLYDHNSVSFPHLMLFAMETIPPLREISLDYGVADEWTGKLAICN